ncbi:hypothetical protein OS42_43260 [Dickeya oryzae]
MSNSYLKTCLIYMKKIKIDPSIFKGGNIIQARNKRENIIYSFSYITTTILSLSIALDNAS